VFRAGWANVKLSENYRFTDKDSKQVVKPLYRPTFAFDMVRDGLVKVKVGKKYGFIVKNVKKYGFTDKQENGVGITPIDLDS